MNNRRQLLIALGAGVLAVPFDAAAQQQIKIWRVAFLVDQRRQGDRMKRKTRRTLLRRALDASARCRQDARVPPSTARTWPVTMLEASEAR